MKYLLAMLCVVALPLPAMAAGDTPLAAGLGMTSCAQFLKSAKPASAAEDKYFAWAQGYMTGVNAMFGPAKADPKNLVGMTIKDQKAAIREYCFQHPLDDYEAALPGLYFLLPGPRRSP